MHDFKDKEDQNWEISLTFGSISRVKAICEVDIFALVEGDDPLLTRLATDVELLVNVIFVLIQPQAEKIGLSDQDWGRLLGGEAILAAQKAFYDELVDFFRQMDRPDVVQAVTIQRTIIARAIAVGEEKIGKFDVDALVERISDELDMSLPG